VCSVLDGGYPALLHHLSSVRGQLEPLVINHEPEKYAAFMRASGRADNDMRPRADLRTWSEVKGKRHQKGGDVKIDVELVDNEVALSVANRLEHCRMAAKLSSRLKELESTAQPLTDSHEPVEGSDE
jgi:hypothetical protein